MSAAIQTASSPTSDALLRIEEGIVEFPEGLALEFGGAISPVRVAWRLAGAPNTPIVLVLGGISAGRAVFPVTSGEAAWWKEVVGVGKALDPRSHRILGIDFLGGSGASTGPQRGQLDFPSISAYDQAALIAKLLSKLGIGKLHAIVGASYGGMVALAFGERFADLVRQLVVISAADRPHPMASAWRSVQRATVKALAAHGAAADGLKLARALAMTTYRSPQEFKQRFDSPPARTNTGFRLPVEDYLYARGQAYADSYIPEAFVCLSESIDLHRVDATKISVPTLLVAVVEDQLVPIEDMRALYSQLRCEKEWMEISSLFGHDAFLKETDALRKAFAKSL